MDERTLRTIERELADLEHDLNMALARLRGLRKDLNRVRGGESDHDPEPLSERGPTAV